MVKFADTEKERQLRKLHQLAGSSIVNNLNSNQASQFQDALNTSGNLNLPHALLNPAVLNTALATNHPLANNPVINPFLNSFANYAGYPSSTAQTAYGPNEFDFSNPSTQSINHLTNPNVVQTLNTLGHPLMNPTTAFLTAGPLMTASLTNNGLLTPVSSGNVSHFLFL